MDDDIFFGGKYGRQKILSGEGPGGGHLMDDNTLGVEYDSLSRLYLNRKKNLREECLKSKNYGGGVSKFSVVTCPYDMKQPLNVSAICMHL